MSGKPKWRSDEDRDAFQRDLLLYGNAFSHVANINGELIIQRLDPAEFMLKPSVAKDHLTS